MVSANIDFSALDGLLADVRLPAELDPLELSLMLSDIYAHLAHDEGRAAADRQ